VRLGHHEERGGTGVEVELLLAHLAYVANPALVELGLDLPGEELRLSGLYGTGKHELPAGRASGRDGALRALVIVEPPDPELHRHLMPPADERQAQELHDLLDATIAGWRDGNPRLGENGDLHLDTDVDTRPRGGAKLV
jgi:hypothetical protein